MGPNARQIRQLTAEMNGGGIRLWPAIAICALLGGFATLAWPRGPRELSYGSIVSIGFAPAEMRSGPHADVATGGAVVRVNLLIGDNCRVGDRISLQRHKTLLGYRYAVAPAGGCTRP